MNTLSELIRKKAESLHLEIQGIREHLHRNPELSYQEHETASFVEQELKKIGITEIVRMAETGVVAMIRGSKHAQNTPCIALRADLDALPITEETGAAYASQKPGIMHACGHDVHTAILLGTAKILFDLREHLPQPVKLVFQPGEEKNPGGASLMIRDGVLRNPEVKAIYALHVFPDLDAGFLGFKEGLYMASCDELYLTIHGKGGHGATPHQCIDPIYIGSTLITSLQNIVSRRCDPKTPCVLSFGHFEALGATNIIPSKAILKGTFRTMDEHWRNQALQEIEQQARQITESMGGKLEIEISRGYPVLINDPQLTQNHRLKTQKYFGLEQVKELPIRLTSEDFSFYSQEIPVCFFRLGTGNKEKGLTYGVHHSKFDIDPLALRVGMEAMSMAPFSQDEL